MLYSFSAGIRPTITHFIYNSESRNTLIVWILDTKSSENEASLIDGYVLDYGLVGEDSQNYTALYCGNETRANIFNLMENHLYVFIITPLLEGQKSSTSICLVANITQSKLIAKNNHH